MARPIGVDISKYQAPQDLGKPHGVVFSTMVEKAAFIVMRAGFAGSAGGAWVDPRVHEYMEDLYDILVQRPIPFAFYWYFRDDVSVVDQANRFSDVVLRWKEVVNLPLVVDAEAFTKDDALSTQKLKDFEVEVERRTKLKVDILYGRAGQLNAETRPGLPGNYPHLWVARYDPRLDSQEDNPWVEGGPQEYVEPRDWDEWTFWQYTESGDEKAYGVTAGAIGIDENVFNGTMEELRSFAGLDKPLPPDDYNWEGNSKVDKKIGHVGTNGVLIEFFAAGEYYQPQFLAVQADYRTYVKIELLLNGTSVPLAKRRVSTTGVSTYSFPQRFILQEGDGVVVEVENALGSDVKMKLVYR